MADEQKFLLCKERISRKEEDFKNLDGAHDVGVSVDEPHELLKAPKAALTALQQTPDMDKHVSETSLDLEDLAKSERNPTL